MLPLYKNIRKRRQELNMSQQELADKLGYKSRSAINKIELGKNELTQSKIIAFAKALNTTPGELMGDVENSTDPDETLAFALWDGDTKDITPQMIERVRQFARFVKKEELERRRANDPDKPV